jgi:hypothetical protein
MSTFKELLILTRIAELYIMHPVTVKPGALFTAQLHIIELRQTFCVFVNGIQQHG